MAEIDTVTSQDIETLTTEYLKEFGYLPKLPIMVTYRIIADLIEDAIISKKPITQEEIDERVSRINAPIDLAD